MAKIKYFYNPSSLKFEKVKNSFAVRALRIFGFISAALVVGFFFLLGAYTYIDSPKEKKLKREIAQLKLQLGVFDKKYDQLAGVLEELRAKDEDIYRPILEADPIPASIREGGYGGVDKYRSLEGFNYSDLVIDLHKKVDKLSSKVYIQSNSFDELIKLASKKSDMLASIPAIQPIANNDLRRMASGFGMRIHPIYKTRRMHTGMDFSAPQGTPIYATGDGTVSKVKYERGYGKHVVINHGFGYQTLYGHMYRYAVKVGQKVKRGELIGYVGSTGNSTAPHVHYEVMKSGRKINPVNFFFNELTAEDYEKIRELAERPTQSFD